VSQPHTDERIDVDPLLLFSTEASAAPEPQQELIDPEPLEATAVPSELEVLSQRVSQLENLLERSTSELGALSSKVATLVAVKTDLRKQVTNDSKSRLISGSAGIALGIIFSAWFWMSTSGDPLLQRTQVEAQSRPDAAVPAPQPGPLPVTQAAIVPVPETSPAGPAVPNSRPAPPAPEAPAPQPERLAGAYVGTLTIDSNPPGDVLIDRKPAGRTPVRAANLKAGSHLIWIQREGHRRFTRVVQVPSDRVTRLVADLEPISPR
jgi:hypothetical protein